MRFHEVCAHLNWIQNNENTIWRQTNTKHDGSHKAAEEKVISRCYTCLEKEKALFFKKLL